MKRVIHVNQHVIRANRKSGDRRPPLTMKTYQGSEKAHEIVLDTVPPVRIRYEPDHPLGCGAHVWVETEAGATPILREEPS